MKFSCGHKADSMLTKDEVQRQRWCFDCDPSRSSERARERQINRDAERRNMLTQASLDAIGMGHMGPLQREQEPRS